MSAPAPAPAPSAPPAAPDLTKVLAVPESSVSASTSDLLLDVMRTVGDREVDEIIAGLYARGELGRANELLRLVVDNDQLLPESLPPSLRAWLEASAAPPPWADEARLAVAAALFSRCTFEIITSLFCASLPSCYAGKRGVQVLHRTARLETDVRRRILETAQLVVDVMAPGGLGSDGKGVRDAQKVRLLHGAVRYLIASVHSGQSSEWKQELGTPINQEDLAGTLLTFSYVCIESIKKLGVAVSVGEEEAYLHAWNVVGHHLGVDRRLQAQTLDEARTLWATIGRRQFAACPEGQAMTKALLDLMEYTLPGTVFDGMPAMLMRHLVGDEVADLLAVPSAGPVDHLFAPLRWWLGEVDAAESRSSLATRAFGLCARKLVEGLAYVGRGGGRAPFTLPSELPSLPSELPSLPSELPSLSSGLPSLPSELPSLPGR